MKKNDKKPKRRLLAWKIAALLLMIACIIAVVYLLVLSKDTQEVPKYKTVSTKFYSTQVPASYRVQIAENPEDTNMVSLLAHDGVAGGNEIGITTNLLAAGGLSGVPDYAYRVSKPAEYKLIADSNLPKDSKLFKKIGSSPAEYVLYLVYDNRFASVQVTGNANTAKLEALLRHVQTNWQWLKSNT